MYDSQGNFINPGLVTQDIGTALANQALGTYSLGPTDKISNPLNGIGTYLPWIAIGLIILLVERK